MWIIPLVMSAKNVWMRFVFIWIVMSTISSIIMKKAMEKPINGSTPRYGAHNKIFNWHVLTIS